MSTEDQTLDNTSQTIISEAAVPMSSTLTMPLSGEIEYTDGGQTRGDETVVVADGQVSSGVVVSSGMVLDVSSGGIALDTHIDYVGTATVSSGGRTSRTVLGSYEYSWAWEDNTEIVLDGGTAEGTIVFYGLQKVFGRATSTVLSSSYYYWDDYWEEEEMIGSQLVLSGGIVESTIIKGGCQEVAAGGTAVQAQVMAGSQLVYDGGIVIDTVLSGRGWVYQ